MNLRVFKFLFALPALAIVLATAFSSCNDQESYADLLEKERKACNSFLADHRVENSIPADSVFEVGPDAPYYRIDEEGFLYMQVLNPGNKEDKAKYDDLIYFRFMRMSLTDLWEYKLEYWDGNADDMGTSPTSFRFGNFSLSSTSQYGQGVQAPLTFLGIGCEVNLVVKSQYGLTDEIAYVTPFLYNIRYFRPQT